MRRGESLSIHCKVLRDEHGSLKVEVSAKDEDKAVICLGKVFWKKVLDDGYGDRHPACNIRITGIESTASDAKISIALLPCLVFGQRPVVFRPSSSCAELSTSI